MVEETTVANRLVVVTLEAVAFERVTLPSEDRPVTERVPEREAEVPERVAMLPVPILRVVMVPLVPVRLVKFKAVVVTPEKVALPPVRVPATVRPLDTVAVPRFAVVRVPEVALNEVANNEVAVAFVEVTFAKVVPPRIVKVEVTVDDAARYPPYSTRVWVVVAPFVATVCKVAVVADEPGQLVPFDRQTDWPAIVSELPDALVKASPVEVT